MLNYTTVMVTMHAIMKKTCFALMISAMLCLLPNMASAFKSCKCSKNELTAIEKYDRAFAVFTGKVIKIRRSFSPDIHKTTFKVYDSWKGAKYETIVIKTSGTDLFAFGREGITCGFKFKKGQEFLIFSYWHHHSGEGLSRTSRCGNIIPLDEAADYTNIFGEEKWHFADRELPVFP